MALDNYCCDYGVLPPPPLDWGWDWELPALGDSAIHEAFPAMLGVVETESPGSSEATSGYLQDAVAHWSGRWKRQRMAAPPAPAPAQRSPATVNEDLQLLLQSFWDDSSGGEGEDLLHDLNDDTVEIISGSFVSEEDDASGREQEQERQGQRGPSAAAAVPQAPARQGGGGEAARPPSSATARCPTAAAAAAAGRAAAAPGLQQKAPTGVAHGAGELRRGGNNCGAPPQQLITGGEPSTPRAASAAASSSPPPRARAGKEEATMKRGVGVLYPFAVVKPLGLDGGGTATLRDVNQRILKRPARPVRHPVGPFACSPAVSAHGLGLSGKTVVSLTKIRTGGKGTITIIRTRG